MGAARLVFHASRAARRGPDAAREEVPRNASSKAGVRSVREDEGAKERNEGKQGRAATIQAAGVSSAEFLTTPCQLHDLLHMGPHIMGASSRPTVSRRQAGAIEA